MKSLLVGLVLSLEMVGGAAGVSSTARASPEQSLFSSQHELGLAFAAMDAIPEPPATSLPPAIVNRVSRSGFFDAQVRKFFLRIANASARYEAHARPHQATAVLHVSRAGVLADEINGTTRRLTLRLENSYGETVTGGRLSITTESALSGFFGDYGLMVRQIICAYERFLADAKKRPYPTQAARRRI
jgi:hypothetical protein